MDHAPRSVLKHKCSYPRPLLQVADLVEVMISMADRAPGHNIWEGQWLAIGSVVVCLVDKHTSLQQQGCMWLGTSSGSSMTRLTGRIGTLISSFARRFSVPVCAEGHRHVLQQLQQLFTAARRINRCHPALQTAYRAQVALGSGRGYGLTVQQDVLSSLSQEACSELQSCSRFARERRLIPGQELQDSLLALCKALSGLLKELSMSGAELQQQEMLVPELMQQLQAFEADVEAAAGDAAAEAAAWQRGGVLLAVLQELGVVLHQPLAEAGMTGIIEHLMQVGRWAGADIAVHNTSIGFKASVLPGAWIMPCGCAKAGPHAVGGPAEHLERASMITRYVIMSIITMMPAGSLQMEGPDGDQQDALAALWACAALEQPDTITAAGEEGYRRLGLLMERKRVITCTVSGLVELRVVCNTAVRCVWRCEIMA